MTQNNNTSAGISACSIVCWLLALAFGIFAASAFIGWLGMHGVVAAVAGLIMTLIAGWLLNAIFCKEEVSTATITTTSASLAENAPAAKSTAAKSTASAKAKPATAKKAAAKSTATKAKSTAANKPAATKKPAAKKSAAAKFYTKAPAKVDDLKLISGVGPKLEKTLNDIGVYQYAQVASWKKAEIKKVDDQLKFKGRIERDDWMKQAKILAKGGETEFSKKKRKT